MVWSVFLKFALTAVWRMGYGEAVAEAMEAWSWQCQGCWKKVSGCGVCFGIGGRGRTGCWGVRIAGDSILKN